MMVTFSKGGGQFLAGKAADNTDDAACIAGTVAGALHVRQAVGGNGSGRRSALEEDSGSVKNTGYLK